MKERCLQPIKRELDANIVPESYGIAVTAAGFLQHHFVPSVILGDGLVAAVRKRQPMRTRSERKAANKRAHCGGGTPLRERCMP